MTNEEKAERLEEIAEYYLPIGDNDLALLCEAAQLFRERGTLLTERDWKGMYEAQERDLAALRKEVEEANDPASVAIEKAEQLRAGLDLARAGEARAVEVLKECHRILAKQSKDPGDYSPKNFDEKQVLVIAEHHGYGNLMALLSSKWYAQQRGGAFSVGDCYATNRRAVDAAEEALSLAQPALDWLAQREREAAQAERMANTDAVRAMGPHFCDFLFGKPGSENALRHALAAACREAIVAELRGLWSGWVRNDLHRSDVGEMWRYICDRIAALTSQQPTACPRSEARGEENNNA